MQSHRPTRDIPSWTSILLTLSTTHYNVRRSVATSLSFWVSCFLACIGLGAIDAGHARVFYRFAGRPVHRSVEDVEAWIASGPRLDMLKSVQRRARPMDRPRTRRRECTPARKPRLEPIPDSQLTAGSGDPAEVAVTRDSVRLAFIAALQHLPPRQRADTRRDEPDHPAHRRRPRRRRPRLPPRWCSRQQATLPTPARSTDWTPTTPATIPLGADHTVAVWIGAVHSRSIGCPWSWLS